MPGEIAVPAPPRPSSAARPAEARPPVRVVVVDDSAVIRGLITRLLEAEDDIQVVGSAANGYQAIERVRYAGADVVILDIEMPEMDGLTALPRLLAVDPAVRIIIASTLSTPGAEVTLRALAEGAADYVPKPVARRDIATGENNGESFRRDLLAKVRALGRARQATRGPGSGPRPTATERKPRPAPAPSGPLSLRKSTSIRPALLAIGCSTGGPQALFSFLGALTPSFSRPILITQHMPPRFTTILAEHVARASRRPAAEARDGDVIRPGHIYIAPGDFHMVAAAEGTSRVLRLTQDPPENFCRPAVDPLFRSLAALFGEGVLALILTGMGSDGLKGSEAVVRAGGTLVAQDEATSVVWGMPGAVARAGLCSAVLPLPEIAQYVNALSEKVAP